MPAPISKVVRAANAAALVTKESMDIPIDYALGVDPPAGTVWFRQAEIDAFLTAQSAPGVKHIEAAWLATPEIILHQLKFSLAAGVHRPKPVGQKVNSTKGHTLQDKLFSATPSRFLLEGPAPSQWNAIVGTQASQLTITSFDNGSSSRDPWVEGATGAFTGLDLRGAFVIFDTGQVSTIHKNTNDRVSILSSMSPVPTTFWVGLPSAIIRNGQTDTGPDAGITGTLRLDMSGYSSCEIKNVSVQPLGGNGLQVSFGNGIFSLTSFLVDQLRPWEDFSINPDGAAFTMRDGITQLSWTGGGYVGILSGGGNDWVYQLTRCQTLLQDCYFGGSPSKCRMSDVPVLYLIHVVHDAINAVEYKSVSITPIWFGGKQNEFRNPQSAIEPALNLVFRCLFDNIGTLTDAIEFSGCQGPCIRIGTQCNTGSIAVGDGIKLLDAGGNSDVGIELVGPHAGFILDAATDVTGTNGDVRMADGRIVSYVDIQNERGAIIQLAGPLAGIVDIEKIKAATAIGVGTLTFTLATSLLQYTAPGDTIGVGVNIVSGGRFILLSGNGIDWVEVRVIPNLPIADQIDTFTLVKVALNDSSNNVVEI